MPYRDDLDLRVFISHSPTYSPSTSPSASRSDSSTGSGSPSLTRSLSASPTLPTNYTAVKKIPKLRIACHLFCMEAGKFSLWGPPSFPRHLIGFYSLVQTSGKAFTLHWFPIKMLFFLLLFLLSMNKIATQGKIHCGLAMNWGRDHISDLSI